MTNQIKKPIPLRIVFIMNTILMFLPFIFYYVVTSKDINVGYEPVRMVYTGIGYILTFIAMVYCILNKNMMLFRIVFIALIVISIPASGFIGMLVALISILLSFNSKVKAYFNS